MSFGMEFLADWMDKALGGTFGQKTSEEWQLVVVCHAMIESALNHAISTNIGRGELTDLIAKLDTSGSNTSKCAFARKLKIIDKQAEDFIRKLSEARNYCVHDIGHFEFTFNKYLANRGEDESTAFCGHISVYLKRRLGKQYDRQYVQEHVAASILSATIMLMSDIMDQVSQLSLPASSEPHQSISNQ